MFTYFVHRVLIMIPTLLAISVLVFIIIQLPPGDYLSNQIQELKSQGDTAALAKAEFLRHEFGLDRPLIEQYVIWLGRLVGAERLLGLIQGDLGYSFEFDLPVTEVVGDRLLLSFIVSFTTIVFTWIVSFPIGVYSATHQYSFGDPP